MAAQAAISAGTYMRPGEWLRTVHNVDLMTLAMIADAVEQDPVHDAAEALTALTMILVTAEGLDIGDDKQMLVYLKQLVMFITLESLYRKGLIDIVHANMSFADDAVDLEIGKVKT